MTVHRVASPSPVRRRGKLAVRRTRASSALMPRAPELLFEHGEVRRHFALELAFRLAGADGIEQPEKEAPDARHVQDSSMSSLSTNVASRRQRSVCLSSARVPALVRL